MPDEIWIKSSPPKEVILGSHSGQLACPFMLHCCSCGGANCVLMYMMSEILQVRQMKVLLSMLVVVLHAIAVSTGYTLVMDVTYMPPETQTVQSVKLMC